MSVDNNPLVAAPPEEIPLRDAPLIRVIAQVRFPIIVSIDKREFIAGFQEELRDIYPVLRQEKIQQLIFGSPEATSTQEMVWRFHDVDGKWRLSLASNFIALETTSYSSRNEFLERLQVALNALSEHIGPRIADRLGLRYIDRVEGNAVADIARLVRPEVIGILATPMADDAQQSISQSLFVVPNKGARLMARWGKIPPNGTVDQAAIEPVDTQSWILDLDMFSEEKHPFNVEELITDARNYAERIYTFFRWAVTDEFLRKYGGKI